MAERVSWLSASRSVNRNPGVCETVIFFPFEYAQVYHTYRQRVKPYFRTFQECRKACWKPPLGSIRQDRWCERYGIAFVCGRLLVPYPCQRWRRFDRWRFSFWWSWFPFSFSFSFFRFPKYSRLFWFVNTEQMFFSATPILVNHFAVFATAWADFVVELLATHLLAAALGEGQDFVDRVFHFRFPFLSLLLISTLYQRFLSCQVLNKCFFWYFLSAKIFRVWYVAC